MTLLSPRIERNSLWPILGILVGWSLAILLVPQFGYQELRALMPAGIALSLGLLLGIVFAVIRQADALFRIEYILIFGVVFWLILDSAQGAYAMWGITRQAILIVFHSAAIFTLCIWLGSFAASRAMRRSRTKFEVPLTVDLIFTSVLVCFFLGMLSVFAVCGLSPSCIVEGLLSARFQSAWQTTSIPGLNATFLLRIKLVGYLVLPLTIVLHHLERRVNWRVVLCFALGFIFLMMLVQAGGRRQVGMILGASVLTWLLLNRPLNLPRLVKAAVVLIGLGITMESMITWRNYGFGQIFVEDVVELEYDRPGFIHVDKNFYHFSLIADVVPARHEHTGWRGVYSVVASSIPRTLVPGKPVYNVIPLRHYLPTRMGRGWNWTCSAVCEFYLIGGYPIVGIGGFFFGILAQLGNHLLREKDKVQNILIYGIYVMTLFIGLRALRELTVIGLVVVSLYTLFYLQRILIRRWRLASVSR